MPAKDVPLAGFLDELASEFHQAKFLPSDPLEFVHRYSDAWDQEAVAVLSALLAYGNVKQIRRSVEDALSRMGAPAAFVRGLGEADGAARAELAFRGFVHRFNQGEDLVRLFSLLSRSWREYGSLGGHLVHYLEPEHETIGPALDALVASWLAWAGAGARGTRRRSIAFRHLLPSPRDGSACKRWCMLLRWMGRKDALDPGLWTERGALAATFPSGRWLRASQLVIPMDTHTGRISRFIGLTSRKALDWKAALEVTRKLRATCDAADPTRYDFALSRLGILDLCQRRYRAEICERCQLRPACLFARAGERRARAAGARRAAGAPRPKGAVAPRPKGAVAPRKAQ